MGRRKQAHDTLQHPDLGRRAVFFVSVVLRLDFVRQSLGAFEGYPYFVGQFVYVESLVGAAGKLLGEVQQVIGLGLLCHYEPE